MKTQFIDPFLTQSRRWSSPVIQFSTTARCPREKFSTTWSTLFCCSLWNSPLYFLSYPIQKPWTTLLVRWSVHSSKPFSLDETFFFVCEKEIQIFGFACSFGLQFHLFWCSVAFHRCPTLSHATHYAREGRGGAFMQRKKQGGKSGIRFS